MRRLVMACTVVAALAACGGDNDPFGPGPNDPVCERWSLTSLNGEPVPGALYGSVQGGSIELLCTGWYRLSTDMGPAADQVFVGRYEQSGNVIEFGASQQGGAMVGTVEGTELQVEPPGGGGLAIYARVE